MSVKFVCGCEFHPESQTRPSALFLCGTHQHFCDSGYRNVVLTLFGEIKHGRKRRQARTDRGTKNPA